MRDPALWEEFIRAARGGQEGAIRRSFEELYASTKDELVRFATWCVSQHNSKIVPRHVLDAEEIVQDAFTDLYRNRDRINKDARSWLLAVIRRTAYFRVSRAVREIKENPGAQRQLDGWRKRSRNDCTVSRDRRAAIRSAVGVLPPRMRAVVVALFYRDESVATAAMKLGISANAVIQARRRAITKLEGMLGEV